jgi:hypothetical protein
MHDKKDIRNSALLLLAVFALLFSVGPRPARAQSPLEYNPGVCAQDTKGAPLSPSCAAMIQAFPAPQVQQIEQDRFTLSSYSFWRVGPDPVNTYDAPNGNVTGQIPRGFNFVNVIDLSVDGWLKIQDGRWLRREDARYTEPSYFRGVTLPKGLKHEFAIVLDKSNIFTSEVPGGKASKNTNRFLKRYELVNIYATAFVREADGKDWRWYMIGPNQWVKQIFVAKAQPVKRPEGVGGHWVAVDLYEQTLTAYQNDTPVFVTLIASGLPRSETREGLFKVWARLERDGMSGATGAPNAYSLQSVPWVMYFDDSISLHGTYWHDLFGYRQSRGCVNLTISDAKWVYQWMLSGPKDREGKPINYVYVFSSGEYGAGVIRQ